MNQEAIQQIVALSKAATNCLPDTDAPAVVLPNNMAIESVEHLFDRPRQMSATYRTERLEDFCKYVNEEAVSGQTAAFVNPDGSGCESVIDFGTHEHPAWGRHKAILKMRHTPEFQGLSDVCGRALSQRDITDWIEDWAHVITPVAAGESVTIPKTIAAIRSVDVKASRNVTHEEADFRASRSAMEEIEAKSSAGNLPDFFDVTCQVYPCTQSRTVRARLSLLTGDDKPHFRLRIMGLENLMKEVAEEIELELTQRLEKVRVFVGSV